MLGRLSLNLTLKCLVLWLRRHQGPRHGAVPKDSTAFLWLFEEVQILLKSFYTTFNQLPRLDTLRDSATLLTLSVVTSVNTENVNEKSDGLATVQ